MLQNPPPINERPQLITFLRPPPINERHAISVNIQLLNPPTTDDWHAPALLPLPPPTNEVEPLAVLLDPPTTTEFEPVFVLLIPPVIVVAVINPVIILFV